MHILKITFLNIGIGIACYFVAYELMASASFIAFILGMNRSNAVMTSSMLGFLYLWILLLWQLPYRYFWNACRNLGGVWIIAKSTNLIAVWIISKHVFEVSSL